MPKYVSCCDCGDSHFSTSALAKCLSETVKHQKATIKKLREALIDCKTNELLESNARVGMTTSIPKCKELAKQTIQELTHES